jgi:hypothetical protein
MPQRTQYTVEAILIEGTGCRTGTWSPNTSTVRSRHACLSLKSLQVLVRTHCCRWGHRAQTEIVYAKIPPIETNDKQVVVQGRANSTTGAKGR